MPPIRNRRPVGDTLGVNTRRMTRVLNSCVCKTPTMFVGAVVFARSEEDHRLIQNKAWEMEKLGNLQSQCFPNLDQLLVEIWKEIPIFLSTEKDVSWEGSQASDDSEVLRDYYYKEMYWCSNEMCDEIISWDKEVSQCIFCGFQNNLSECERFSEEPSGEFMRLYPEKLKPILSCVRSWFEELPTLKMVGVELGLTTYNFGAKIRRQLKLFPRAFHQDNEKRFGELNSGVSNKCLPVPKDVRYEGLQSEKWYSDLFESEYSQEKVIFEDKNYLLGDESCMYENGSSAWF